VKLYAISDLHVGSPGSRETIAGIEAHPEDWLILAGDIGETPAHLEWALRELRPRFRQLLWVPGNHELWTLPSDPDQARGEARYRRLVELCRSLGVLTPEDPYPAWPGDGDAPIVLAPLFTLYDYTFREPGTTMAEALEAAIEAGIVCTDEFLLHPDPHATRQEWCRHRVAATAARLEAIPERCATVLISHFPLRRELAVLPRIPQFALWCGTTLTDDWHRRFRALAVVYGHLHIRRTSWRDGVLFEEVSAVRPALRQVLPLLPASKPVPEVGR
jgi:3',5'-cyclic AMP phosphodiesterase CpdA